jgi:hypothetical protein
MVEISMSEITAYIAIGWPQYWVFLDLIFSETLVKASEANVHHSHMVTWPSTEVILLNEISININLL